MLRNHDWFPDQLIDTAMMEAVEDLICPFCGFRDRNDYQMLLHVETFHPEDGSSPFVVRDAVEARQSEREEATARSNRSSTVLDEYVDCPHKCGERIPQAELQFHCDLHLAEDMAIDDSNLEASTTVTSKTSAATNEPDDTAFAFSTTLPEALRNRDPISSPKTEGGKHVRIIHRKTPSLKELFYGSSSWKSQPRKTADHKIRSAKRLGVSLPPGSSERNEKTDLNQTTELGPYANEKRMPSWLQRMLEEGPKVTISNKIGTGGSLIRKESVANETPDLIHVFARLSLLDRSVAGAFYCRPQVRHVAKMKDEGGFCGYRNIQMLISQLEEAQLQVFCSSPGKLPSIIRLQDMIEDAWDQGYNAIGRVETGGIRLTRKYIGTSEAQALFQSLGIQCEVAAFFSTSESQAHLSLLQAVLDYFNDEGNNQNRVAICDKPPIYFQHRGHSMTIVGVEVQYDGAANLVVFDPMFNPSAAIKKLINKPNFRCENPSALLKAHRRGETYLSRYKTYEVLQLSQPAQHP